MAIVAYRISMSNAIVDAVLKIAGFATGLVLGLYGLGILVPRATQPVALAAFAVGAVVTSWTAFATPLNGYWYTLVGSGTIVIVGLVLHVMSHLVKPHTALVTLAACFFATVPAAGGGHESRHGAADRRGSKPRHREGRDAGLRGA